MCEQGGAEESPVAGSIVAAGQAPVPAGPESLCSQQAAGEGRVTPAPSPHQRPSASLYLLGQLLPSSGHISKDP